MSFLRPPAYQRHGIELVRAHARAPHPEGDDAPPTLLRRGPRLCRPRRLRAPHTISRPGQSPKVTPDAPAASLTVFPILPDSSRRPETGRDPDATFGEIGLAAHWIRILPHRMFLYEERLRPGWWLVPEQRRPAP